MGLLEIGCLSSPVPLCLQLDESLHQKIREPMATIRSVIQTISALAVTAEQDLESELFSSNDSFQALLDQAATKTVNGPLNQELREVRMSCLPSAPLFVNL